MNLRKNELKKGEIIPLNFDYVFNNIFGKEESIEILESFLSSYLEIPLEEIKGKVRILNRELETMNKKEKDKQVDILLELNKEKSISN